MTYRQRKYAQELLDDVYKLIMSKDKENQEVMGQIDDIQNAIEDLEITEQEYE